MSFKCAICGKGPTAGKSISHSHKASLRTFRPNLQRQKMIVKGKVVRNYVCTSCIRSGKIQKAI
ncbi:50S ribosomal protein L28 [Elusimicrobiota bacterium]